MRNFKLTIEYDGTNYLGWQRQTNGDTIQGKLENALQRLFNRKVSLAGSGRTDSGVHALGQVASFKTETDIPLKNILRALNTYLPEDIFIKDIKEVPLSFHARFSVKKKWYRYTIIRRHSVFNRYYAVYYPYKLDIRLMKRAGRTLKHTINISSNGDFIYIDVIGRGFLYKMVRKITGMLLNTGRGKEIGQKGKTAPAKGLTLMKVYY